MNHLIIIIALFSIYFHIAGLSTTNIIRLTAGCTLPINSSKCVCDACGTKITPFLQLPVISYIICKGKCKNCGCKIPVDSLILEIVIMTGMSIISAVFQFKPIGVLISFVFYELSRIVVVLLKGKRAEKFKQQYIVAFFSMLPSFLCAMFAAVLYQIV